MNATLGLDTSGRVGSVCLRRSGDDGAPDLERSFTRGMVHGVELAPAVRDVLREAGLAARELTLIAVGTGPGSYTGVRVGVAFAKTLAFATGVPVVGVPSFEAMALLADAPLVACVRDARRGAVYLGLYRPREGRPCPDGPIRVVPVEELAKDLPPEALRLGDTDRLPDFLSGEWKAKVSGIRDARAREIARLGEIRARAGETIDPHDLVPVYFRPSEAEERLSRKDGGQE